MNKIDTITYENAQSKLRTLCLPREVELYIRGVIGSQSKFTMELYDCKGVKILWTVSDTHAYIWDRSKVKEIITADTLDRAFRAWKLLGSLGEDR